MPNVVAHPESQPLEVETEGSLSVPDMSDTHTEIQGHRGQANQEENQH